jgi:hypothetical protein
MKNGGFMSEWISVKDRLPQPLEDVLAHELRGRIFIGYCAETFIGNPIWYVGGYGAITITHWMPLPNPPEEI